MRDWLSDPQLKMVSYQTKGIWIDLLCYLWESPERGKIEGTPEQFMQMIGCSEEQWNQFFKDATVTKFANVTNCNGIVTVCNRRMFREEKERKNTRLRVQKYRDKEKGNGKSNAPVTPPSSSSSSKKKKYIKKTRKFKQEEFDTFYKTYPKRQGKDKALENWKKKLKDNKLPPLEEILNAIKNQAEEKESKRQSGQFVSEWPMPQVWIKDGRWKDEVEKIERYT